MPLTVTTATVDYNAVFASNLRILREAMGYTQEGIAIKLRIKSETYQQWEKGRRFPNTFTLLRLSDFFEVTINDLLTVQITKAMAA